MLDQYRLKAGTKIHAFPVSATIYCRHTESIFSHQWLVDGGDYRHLSPKIKFNPILFKFVRLHPAALPIFASNNSQEYPRSDHFPIHLDQLLSPVLCHYSNIKTEPIFGMVDQRNYKRGTALVAVPLFSLCYCRLYVCLTDTSPASMPRLPSLQHACLFEHSDFPIQSHECPRHIK